MPETAPLSPFIPGTNVQFAWDSTSLGYLKTCPRLYYYQMIEGWQSKTESIHLRFGIEFHQALQDYDIARADGTTHNDAVSEVIRELLSRTADFTPDTDVKPGKYKNRESLVRTVIYYLDDRANDPFKTYIMSNGRPAVELSFRFTLETGPDCGAGVETDGMNEFTLGQKYVLCGHLDRVCESPDGDLYIEDHKTTTTTPGQYYFDQYEPNNQMSLYTLGGQVIFDTTIKGVMINAVQLLLTEPYARFQRGFTFRNKDQITEWLADTYTYLQLAEWYAVNATWPMNDTACDKYGGCKFRKVCAKAPNVRHIYLASDFTQLPEAQRWNPLANRG